MATETERKFLVLSDAWRENAVGVTYRQGYLSAEMDRTVRVRVAGDEGYITIKGAVAADGISRAEYEYKIPKDDAEAMLKNLCLPGAIEKTRYKIPHGDVVFEVDVFHGANDGLIVAEVELHGAEQAFSKPAWLGLEVSLDGRYTNAALSKNPYKNWAPK